MLFDAFLISYLSDLENFDIGLLNIQKDKTMANTIE
jgi:hypothetical protein